MIALLFTALLSASGAGDCVSAPERGEGWIVLESPGTTLEIWRFGSKVGTTPLKLALPAGCAQIEARRTDGKSQLLRLEIEPRVEKTLAVKLEGPAAPAPAPPAPAPKDQAKALLDRAFAGDRAAQQDVLRRLEQSFAGPTPAPTAPATCVRRGTGEFGFMTINTQPASRIFLDGQAIGETPLSRAKVPAGCLEVEAVTEDGRRQKVQVDIQPNRVGVFSFEFR